MRPVILGTAGHIDHGKTALVRALTGTDTDRLPEEKRRGITIDLGFAHLRAGELDMGIVDVPGHEGFIRNMLAGATGIDLVLLVVAADEGVMPQTREHLAIVELLGVRAGVVAVTKRDLVEPEWLDLVLEEIRESLAATPFRDAPLLPVSSVTGQGIAELRTALAEAGARVAPRDARDLFRLPVDRVFTIRGTGTVVTGTVWSGALESDAVVRHFPGERTARVRGLQVHGEAADRIEAGQRAAIALAGVDRAGVERGDVITTGDGWAAASALTVRVSLHAASPRPLAQRQRVRVHLGTAEAIGRVVLLAGQPLEPGDEGWAQLRLERPLLARRGDRCVLRSYSPVTTIGGAIVVEPDPPRRRRLHGDDEARYRALLAGSVPEAIAAVVEAGGTQGVPVDRLAVLAGCPPQAAAQAAHALAAGGAALAIGNRLFAGRLAGPARAAALAAVDAWHAAHPLEPGIGREELRRGAAAAAGTEVANREIERLLGEGQLVARGPCYARPDFAVRLSPDQERARQALVALYAAAGLAPPTLAELPPALAGRPDLRALLRILEQEGELVPLTPELLVARGALAGAGALVRAELSDRKELTPADFKEILPLTRKHLIPLLEYLDRSGVTRRQGEGRVVNPPPPPG
jgi:selenocysteine-specific elongation factor